MIHPYMKALHLVRHNQIYPCCRQQASSCSAAVYSHLLSTSCTALGPCRSAFFEPGAAAAPVGSIPEEVQQAGNELLAAAPGHTLELQLVRFAASSSGVRSFGVSASGEVFKTTGVTTTMAARSTAAFLQKLLT